MNIPDATIQIVGMSARDYFAAHATDEDIRLWRDDNVGFWASIFKPTKSLETAKSEVIEARYRFADAMIKASQK